MRSVRSWLAVLVAFALLLAGGGSGFPPALAQEAGCVLCAGQKSLACPTCKGQGRAARSCAACDGEGRSRCAGRREKLPDLPDWAMAVSGFHRGTERGCPHRLCRGGKVTWDDGKSYRCRLCGGDARVTCIDCRDAQKPCAACRGKKAVDGPCPDCGGTGRLACLPCEAGAAKCGACGGDARLPCKGCRDGQQSGRPCLACSARGAILCRACSGLGKVACGVCAATAKYRERERIVGPTTVSKECGACDGKGVVACEPCQSAGHVRCDECEGAGSVSGNCLVCRGTAEVPCTACGDRGHRAAELEAGLLVAARATEAGVAMYERAHQRVRAWVGKTADARRKAAEAVGRLDRDGGSPSAEDLKDVVAWTKRLTDRMRETNRLLEALIEATTEADDAAAAEARIAKALEQARKALPKPPAEPAPTTPPAAPPGK